MAKEKILILFILIGITMISGCNISTKNSNESIYQGQNNYARFELPQSDNECNHDSECFVGGCNDETCTAMEPKSTTCDVAEGTMGGLSCKCVDNQCIWVKE